MNEVVPQKPCPHGFYNHCAICGQLTKVTVVEPDPRVAINAGFILTQPEQIQAWRLLALYHMLKLELVGMHHSSGQKASVAIRKILGQAERGAPRDRQRLIVEYQKYLVDLGLIEVFP